ncbi:monocarboxylate transporter 2-like isoform X3 [Chironomus tepperi]|uniref:monocarboxylate transporter 2-like isoform X3 n=1 Tax=Chironomus tepperi TaxID=113505 RepID=UPI00391FBEC1
MASLIRALSWPLITTTPLESNEKHSNGSHNLSNGKNRKHTPTFQQLMAARRLICRRYYPEAGFGWIVMFVGLIVNTFTHGLQLSAIFFLLPAVIRFKADEVDCLGWLGALSTAVALFISPLTIGVCKRKSTRITAVIGGLVTALGCLFTSFASQFHQMFFSYGTVVGIGVGMCRDCSTLMIAQYFKRKREFVEIFIVSGSGAGIALMSTFIKSAIEGVGWRLGLQAVTVCVFSTFILGTCYRSASLYHPQRRAILHLKNQKRKIKDKTKQFENPPFFDFSTLKSKTVRILLLSSAITAFGINTPLFYLAHQITLDGLSDEVLMLQVYLGCSWVLGCVIFGLLVVKNSVECRIARQYLCQTAMFMCGLTMLSLTTIRGNYHAYLLFVWIYGIFLGGYHYSLKMFTFEKVRARNFARAWGFVQFSQALPIALGVPFAGYLNLKYPGQVGYYMCAGCSIVGSLTLFLVDVHKRNVRLHKEKSTKENGTGSHTCSQTCQKRKLSFDNEQDHEPALQGTAALILGTEILVPHINDVLMNAVNGIDKPELTCISEEGIADMDYLPENLLDEFDFNNLEDNDDDDITSCNKIKYSLSEMENNGTGMVDGKKIKRGATIRNNNKNFLSLTAQVIPELSHESQDEEKSILINGHHVDCNVNKHLRNNSEQTFTAPAFPVANNRMISVIEEAAV